MNRKLYPIAGICSIGILSTIFVAAINKDNTGPEIKLLDNTITVGSTDVRIEDIRPHLSVTDQKDGDVSDSLRIESAHITESGKTVKMILVAMDKSYNVGKEIFEFPLENNDIQQSNPEQNGPTKQEQNSANNNNSDTNIDNNTEDENIEDNTGENISDENNGTEDNQQTVVDYAAMVEQEIAAMPPDYPQMRLNTYEVTLTPNQRFSYLNYIDSIVDSEDERSYLYAHIHLDNKLKKDTPGEYTVSYYAIDSDGNHSNTAVLHVTVSEE